jgi:hypothetical protein
MRWTTKGPLGSKRLPTETASLGSRDVRTPPSRRGVVVSRGIADSYLDPHRVRRPSPLPRLVLEKRTYRGQNSRVSAPFRPAGSGDGATRSSASAAAMAELTAGRPARRGAGRATGDAGRAGGLGRPMMQPGRPAASWPGFWQLGGVNKQREVGRHTQGAAHLPLLGQKLCSQSNERCHRNPSIEPTNTPRAATRLHQRQLSGQAGCRDIATHDPASLDAAFGRCLVGQRQAL